MRCHDPEPADTDGLGRARFGFGDGRGGRPDLCPAPTSPPPTASATPTPTPIPRNPAPVDESVPYLPAIDPADFSTTIDNPFLPWVPGTTFVYEGGGEHIEVTVTADTRTVMGVETVVVRDTVTVKGKVTEDTFDWYAQDRFGNVWYFGEDTAGYANGKISSTTGIVGGRRRRRAARRRHARRSRRRARATTRSTSRARPKTSEPSWRLDDTVSVPYGSLDRSLVTEDTTPLEPQILEHKFYARGVGDVAERVVGGGHDLVELIEVRQPGN